DGSMPSVVGNLVRSLNQVAEWSARTDSKTPEPGSRLRTTCSRGLDLNLVRCVNQVHAFRAVDQLPSELAILVQRTNQDRLSFRDDFLVRCANQVASAFGARRMPPTRAGMPPARA